ncbi:uncharacterized protein LOC129739229 [Uranotaenia lowii]|uniref:uncharacterized protein LOC129739229 n=1 Tax=Uranotaenia lowii TaxID=190385 RepID=UPI00247AF463|nr:uncharacterized protein LOC129739229 [Uranotaenia lowii]
MFSGLFYQAEPCSRMEILNCLEMLLQQFRCVGHSARAARNFFDWDKRPGDGFVQSNPQEVSIARNDIPLMISRSLAELLRECPPVFRVIQSVRSVAELRYGYI